MGEVGSMKRSIVAQLTAIVLLFFVVPAPAQAPAPPQAEEGDVVLDGQTVIRILAPAGQVSAKDRAATVQQRLDRARQEGPIAPADVVVRVVDANPSIFVKNRLILTVYGADAQAYKLSAAALAESWASKLREALAAAPGPSAGAPPPGAPAPAAPAPPQPPAPAAAAPPPTSPSPPRPTAWRLFNFYERVSSYRPNTAEFKLGYAAGAYDAVSMFARAAQGSGIVRQDAIDMYECLKGKGTKLGELRDWVNSVTGRAPDGDPVASALATACQHSLSTGRYFWGVSKFRPLPDDHKLGYAAGIFDGVSLVAAAADGPDVNARISALHECLRAVEQGKNLGDLRAWVDSVVQTSSDSDPAAGVIAGACNH